MIWNKVTRRDTFSKQRLLLHKQCHISNLQHRCLFLSPRLIIQAPTPILPSFLTINASRNKSRSIQFSLTYKLIPPIPSSSLTNRTTLPLSSSTLDNNQLTHTSPSSSTLGMIGQSSSSSNAPEYQIPSNFSTTITTITQSEYTRSTKTSLQSNFSASLFQHSLPRCQHQEQEVLTFQGLTYKKALNTPLSYPTTHIPWSIQHLSYQFPSTQISPLTQTTSSVIYTTSLDK